MPDRRVFLKNTLLSSTGLLILPLLSFGERHTSHLNTDDLEKGFAAPPASAKPQAYWMWMNGHITKRGITLDLEAMKEMGLAGAFIYNTGVGVPKGKVAYGSPEWDNLVAHAMAEAKRLGLELFLHNSPGYSSTGGAKVEPGLSMQQLVWSELAVESKGAINVRLPQPLTKFGYYRDVSVIAFPTPAAERQQMQEKLLRVTVNGREINKEDLFGNRPGFRVELTAGDNQEASLQLEFAEPYEARYISVTREREPSVSVYDDAYDHPPAMRLEHSSDGKHYQMVCTINMPWIRHMEAPGTENFPPVKAKYFRLTASKRTIIIGVNLHAGSRLAGWPGKTNLSELVRASSEQHIDQESIIDPSTVVNLAGRMQADGRLSWEAPPGHWTILRFGHTCTGTTTVAVPDDAGGLEIDKFSKEAVDRYFQLHLHPLFQKLRPFLAKTFQGVFIDSYEVGRQNWTHGFPSIFQQRKHYNLTAWLPALTGRVVRSVTETEKFLWDLRRVQADLVAENYYGHFKKKCAAYGLHFYTQPYGDGVFDGLQVGQYSDVALAEFWTRYVPGTLNQSKQAVSIAHGYGKKIVAAEAYTGMPTTARWTEYPYALKSQGDYMYSLGINRFVFHVFVHQPYTTGLPGMSMGPYGTHFDRYSTWHSTASEWVRYLTRTQYLLQQGVPVADVCYFKGEDPASGIPDVNYVDPPVPKNLAGDVIGPDVLMNRLKIAGSKIVLPDGMQYSLMILAPLKKVSPPVLQKLKSLVEMGMVLVVMAKPTDTPGWVNESEGEKEVKQLTGKLWGNLDGETVKDRSFGKGKIYWNKPFADILRVHNIKPDFEFSATNSDAAIHYTHRKVGETDIYFISNHLRRNESFVCRFRVKNKCPELWDAERGEKAKAAVYSLEEEHVVLPVELSPAGSLFVVFREKADNKSYQAIYQDETLLLSAKPYIAAEKPFQTVTNNFTITLWIKPDTLAWHPKGVVLFPPEAETVYGSGHAACGLSAGQNGVRVYEREKGANHSARPMITWMQPLEGWTHVALRYSDGTPSLFINGRLAAEGKASGKMVHPGLGTPPTDEFFSAAFEGGSTPPELHPAPLKEEEIHRLFEKGLPLPELPSAIAISQTPAGALRIKAWQNGNYRIEGRGGVKEINIAGCEVIPVNLPWQVSFPPHSGAPSIRLRELRSLHLHPHFDVKHFSGTAIYQTAFVFPNKGISKEQRILLDLGRVEVMAEVELNGRSLGVLWKEPFRVDVTNALRPGTNRLVVKVTNLWPNRLIGDAHLPPENEYDENGFVTRYPSWYLNNQPKPGKRKTFAVWNTFTKEDPLLASGLLGPVRLITGWEKIIT